MHLCICDLFRWQFVLILVYELCIYTSDHLFTSSESDIREHTVLAAFQTIAFYALTKAYVKDKPDSGLFFPFSFRRLFSKVKN